MFKKKCEFFSPPKSTKSAKFNPAKFNPLKVEEFFRDLSSFFGQVEYTDPSDINVDRGQYLLLVRNDFLRTLSVLDNRLYSDLQANIHVQDVYTPI